LRQEQQLKIEIRHIAIKSVLAAKQQDVFMQWRLIKVSVKVSV